MAFNAAAHYACLAMLDLALHQGDGTPVRAADITHRNDIPGPYLLQILRSLKSAGWVRATRGSQGGYQLVADPADISLLDIAEAVGCGETASPCEATENTGERALRRCWQRAVEKSRQELAKIRLSDLATECKSQDAAMFYI